jgi:UMF1 family MFS transporter
LQAGAPNKGPSARERLSNKLNWRKALPWAFYDWANSAYATTVLAGLFPIFLKQYWMPPDTPVEMSTFRLGAANSAAGIIVACLAPILGAIADRGGARKRFLIFFAMMGIVMTGALHFVAKGNWVAAVLLYVTATIGFAGANIFYDSLLVSVADEGKFDMVSALGYSMGYLGGGLLFAFNVLMVTNPAKFGFVDEAEAVKRAFIMVAIW